MSRHAAPWASVRRTSIGSVGPADAGSVFVPDRIVNSSGLRSGHPPHQAPPRTGRGDAHLRLSPA